MKKEALLYCLIVTFILLPKPAYAYLDPGTGSYLFQIFIASLLGGVFFLKSYWQKIKDWSNNRSAKKDLKAQKEKKTNEYN